MLDRPNTLFTASGETKCNFSICFNGQKWRYVAFTHGSRYHAYGHRRFNQIQQALLQESKEHYTRCTASAIVSMRRTGRAVMTAHDALSCVMSIVIFTFTPDGIHHAFVMVKFQLLY